MVIAVARALLDLLPKGWEVVTTQALDPYDGGEAALVRFPLTDLYMLAGEDGRLRPINQHWARQQFAAGCASYPGTGPTEHASRE